MSTAEAISSPEPTQASFFPGFESFQGPLAERGTP